MRTRYTCKRCGREVASQRHKCPHGKWCRAVYAKRVPIDPLTPQASTRHLEANGCLGCPDNGLRQPSDGGLREPLFYRRLIKPAAG